MPPTTVKLAGQNTVVVRKNVWRCVRDCRRGDSNLGASVDLNATKHPLISTKGIFQNPFQCRDIIYTVREPAASEIADARDDTMVFSTLSTEEFMGDCIEDTYALVNAPLSDEKG